MTKMTKKTVILLLIWVILTVIYMVSVNIFPIRPLYGTIVALILGLGLPLVLLLPWGVHIWETCRFTCPYCHKTFKPAFKHSFALKALNKYLMTCPHCGKKDYMEILKDKPAIR